MLNVGFNNYVNVDKITSIASVHKHMPSPIRRVAQAAEDEGKLIDLTAGRRTRSVIFTVSGQVVLSSVEGATLVQRLRSNG